MNIVFLLLYKYYLSLQLILIKTQIFGILRRPEHSPALVLDRPCNTATSFLLSPQVDNISKQMQ